VKSVCEWVNVKSSIFVYFCRVEACKFTQRYSSQYKAEF